MYKELLDYFIDLQVKHVDVNHSVLTHAQSLSQAMNSMQGVFLAIEPLRGLLTGRADSPVTATNEITLLFAANHSNQDVNLTNAGYHESIDKCMSIALDFIARIEFDISQDQCPVNILSKPIRWFQQETQTQTWAGIGITFSYIKNNAVTYNPLKWQ